MAYSELNVTIISAKNIKAGDMNGLSDGYVKFATSQTKKQKTKIYKPSLNPEWNETFTCKAVVGERIVFKVMDHDKVTRDDK